MTTTTTLEKPTLQSIFRGFAGPMAAMDFELYYLLVTSYANESLAQFLNKMRSTFDSSEPLMHFLKSKIEGAVVTREVAWDVSFGFIHTSLLFETTGQALLEAAAKLSLWLHLQGYDGVWQVEFEQAIRLRMGRFYLPELRHFSCRASRDRIEIQDLDDPGKRFVFEKAAGEWHADGVHAFPQIVWGDHRITLINDPALVLGNVDVDQIIQDEDGIALMQALGERTFAWLDRHAKDYLEWVLRTIRYIIPTRSENGALNSGSTKFFYGQIHASLPEIPLSLAETLVHESSHQHYYVASRFMSPINGQDTTWYYSPPVRADRQIDLILLAFHAFVNVLALSRRCDADDVENWDYACRNEISVGQDVRDLLGPLLGTDGLSSVGLGIAQPLFEYLQKD